MGEIPVSPGESAETTVSDETIDRILRRVATWPGVTITDSTELPNPPNRSDSIEPPTGVSWTPEYAKRETTPDPSAEERETTPDPPVEDEDTMPDPPVEGTVIRVGEAVIAGLDSDGLLDIPVERRLRDQLLTEGRADRHPTVPTGNRVSYRIARQADVTGAMWLLRVAHLARCCRDGTLSSTAVSRRVRMLRLTPELARLIRSGDATTSRGATDGRQSVPPHRFRD